MADVEGTDVSELISRSEKQEAKIDGLEKQLDEMSLLLKSVASAVGGRQQGEVGSAVVGRQQGEVEESSESVAAPGGTGPESGTHRSDAADGTVGGTGRTLGQNLSGVGVGSSSSFSLGFDPITSSVDRTTAGTAGFGTIGLGRHQAANPPPPTAASEWWGRLDSGNTLIPGTTREVGDGSSRSLLRHKIPKAPVFEGTEVSYPSWSQNFLLSSKHHNFYEACVCDVDIPICEIGF